jgi:hypothetical protein
MLTFSVLLLCFIALLLAASFVALRIVTVGEPALDGGATSLSIIVAAQNEAPRIGDFVKSVLAQDHPDFELIVVDDRSSDETRRKVASTAGSDPRVRICRVDHLPPGWQGRLYAQSVGAAGATGDWLLFLSADQRLGSTTFLRSMVAAYEARGVAAVSAIGPFVGSEWWKRWWFHPIANNPIVWGAIILIQRCWPGAVWLVGALGMRRSTYHALGGGRLAASCGAGLFDDFGWSRLIQRSGLRAQMVYHPELRDIGNWESFREFWCGISRWVAGIFTYRRRGWLTAGLCALALLAMGTGTLDVLWDVVRLDRMRSGSVVLSLVAPLIGVGYCAWERRSYAFAVAMPLMIPLALAVLAGGAWARVRNRVVWKGESLRVVVTPPSTSSISFASRRFSAVPHDSR